MDFTRFSERLENFMQLANVLVVTKGGLGTMLELCFCWQLLQVHHSEYKPIILIGKMWEKLIRWMKKYMLKQGLMGKQDFEFIKFARNNKAAMKIIDDYHDLYVRDGLCSYRPKKPIKIL
jgi:hypothetical protein